MEQKAKVVAHIRLELKKYDKGDLETPVEIIERHYQQVIDLKENDDGDNDSRS